MHPEALTAQFQCSENFVRSLLQSKMNWSPRVGTRSAAKLPDDADEQCERTLFRICYALHWNQIPPELLINIDQQGMYVLPNCSTTWETVGTKQIDVIAKDEKRAYTILVGSTPTGDILPFQAFWGGKTAGSLPKDDAPGMDDAKARGFHFAAAASETSPRSHFSTLKTMKEYVVEVIQPYIKKVIDNDPSLDTDQMAILFLDAYPVHTSAEFRAYMAEKHPNIILIYVLANCTGKFQPADVGLQRPIKHMLKQNLFEWMAQGHQDAIAWGAQPEEIKVTTSLPKLRDASVQGLVNVYDYMKTERGQRIIKKVCFYENLPKYYILC
jgi:hypothetical protein